MANILNDNLTQQLIAVGFPQPQSVLSAKMDHQSILSVEIGYSLDELWQWLPIGIRDFRTGLYYCIRVEYSMFLGWQVVYYWERDWRDTDVRQELGEHQVLISAGSDNLLEAVAGILLECARLQACRANYNYARGGRPFENFLNAHNQ